MTNRRAPWHFIGFDDRSRHGQPSTRTVAPSRNSTANIGMLLRMDAKSLTIFAFIRSLHLHGAQFPPTTELHGLQATRNLSSSGQAAPGPPIFHLFRARWPNMVFMISSPGRCLGSQPLCLVRLSRSAPLRPPAWLFVALSFSDLALAFARAPFCGSLATFSVPPRSRV